MSKVVSNPKAVEALFDHYTEKRRAKFISDAPRAAAISQAARSCAVSIRPLSGAPV